MLKILWNILSIKHLNIRKNIRSKITEYRLNLIQFE